eukprot:4872074-Prymnesium_polylepis.1
MRSIVSTLKKWSRVRLRSPLEQGRGYCSSAGNLFLPAQRGMVPHLEHYYEWRLLRGSAELAGTLHLEHMSLET